MNNVYLENNQEYNWSLSNFEWTESEWSFVQDSMETSKDASDAYIPYSVVNPFDYKQDISYPELHIKLNGTGKHTGYQNGRMYYEVKVDNYSPGQEKTETYEVSPVLDGSMFNLPNGKRYIVGDVKMMNITWK